LFRNTWSTFVGFGPGLVVDCLKGVQEDLDFEYDFLKQTPRFKDFFIYGSNEDTTIFEVKNPVNINIEVLDVSADPLFRGLYSFITSKENFKELTEDISRISIYPINRTTEPFVETLIKKLAGHFPENPWGRLQKHPRFRTSPILYLRVKRQWEQWIG